MGHNTLVVYNDVAKRFILLPDGEGIPSSGIQTSADPGNGLQSRPDGLWSVSVDHMSWNSLTGSLVIHLTDGTTHSVPLPTASSPPLEYESVATQPGEQILSLPFSSKSVGHNLYINGLKQSTGSYTILGNALTVPADLLVQVNDLIAFTYFQL